MSYETARLLTNPLFMDALSGEFTPASDPSRIHTLGRLMVATFQKGEVKTGPWETVGRDLAYVLAYRPSWASFISSRVTCLEKSNWVQITGLWLHKDDAEDDEGTLGIVDHYSFGDNPGHLRVVGLGEAPTDPNNKGLPLDLGQPLNETREAVTKAAQSFFS